MWCTTSFVVVEAGRLEMVNSESKSTFFLILNSEQESQVAQVLKNSREILKESYKALKLQEESAMQLHSEPGSGDELRAVYEKYRIELEKINSQENLILSKQLKGILTEEQLNKLLEYQATQKVGLR